MANILKGLIKCTVCNKNYKYKLERKQPSYVCSGFANYGKDFCRYYPIKEHEIIDIINKHFNLTGTRVEGNIANFVKRINVSEKGYKIYYHDGLSSIIDESVEYGIKVRY